MRISFRILILLSAISIIAASPGHASSESCDEERCRLLAPPELESLLERAMADSPRVRAAHERLESIRTFSSAAGALEEPIAGVAYQNDTLNELTLGTSEFSQVVLSYAQTFPGSGKRSLRRQSAGMDAQIEEPAVRRAEYDLRLDILRAWWSLAYQLQARGVLGEQKEIIDEIEAAARSRYGVGQGRQQEIVKAQIGRLRVLESLAISEGSIGSLRAELRGHLCMPPDEELPDPGPLPELPAPASIEAEIERAMRLSPELDRLERAAAAADSRVEVAKGDYRPDYTLGGSYMYRGSLDPMIAVSLGVRLPVFRKNRLDPALASASGEAASIRSGAASLKIQLAVLTTRRAEIIRSARESSRLLRDGVLPLDRLALDSALAGYRSGQGDILSLLDGMNSLHSDRLELTRRTLLIATESAALEAVSLAPPAEFDTGPERGAAPGAMVGSAGARALPVAAQSPGPASAPAGGMP